MVLDSNPLQRFDCVPDSKFYLRLSIHHAWHATGYKRILKQNNLLTAADKSRAGTIAQQQPSTIY